MWARAALNRLHGVRFNQLWCCNHLIYGDAAASSSLMQRRRICLEKTQVELDPSSWDKIFSLTKEQMDSITESDPLKERKLHELQLTLLSMRELGEDMPSHLRLTDITQMINQNPFQLKRMLKYVNGRSSRVMSDKFKKETYIQSREEARKARVSGADSWLENRLNANSIFLRLYKNQSRRLCDMLTFMAHSDAQKLIIDCSYDSYMNELRLRHAAFQIILCCVYNRSSRRPFYLQLCNLQPDGRLMYHLKQIHPGIEYDAPMLVQSSSYLELFDSERLVYLSPHSTRTLEYHPDDIYIVGGFVDTQKGEKLSTKKAVHENIRHASLPLDMYMKWKLGSKNLCIHQCFGILLDVKNTGGWTGALNAHVPPRKVWGERGREPSYEYH